MKKIPLQCCLYLGCSVEMKDVAASVMTDRQADTHIQTHTHTHGTTTVTSTAYAPRVNKEAAEQIHQLNEDCDITNHGELGM